MVPYNRVLALLLTAMLPRAVAAPAPQLVTMRMVIGGDVVCRTEPNRSAPMSSRFRLGETFSTEQESREQDGSWYFARYRRAWPAKGCWVHGPLTAEFDRSHPEAALVAAANHILARADQVRFEEYVAVEALLTHDYASAFQSSGILQFRRLSIIQRAISLPTATGRAAERNPLTRSWLSSHEDLISYYDPADRWFLPPEPYWELYEKHRLEPWAEELAWTAAQVGIPADECYAECALEILRRTYEQYWTRYPKGAFIGEAIEKASSISSYASTPDCEYSQVSPKILSGIRESLAPVTAPAKSAIIDALNKLEQAQKKCPAPP